MRVAVIQLRDAPPDTAANLLRGLTLLARAADEGARLALLPELFLTGYYLDQQMGRRALSLEQPLARLQAAVDELGICAVFGLPWQQGDVLYNAVAVMRPGEPQELCAKTHLFGREQQVFARGGALWTGDIAGWPCGIAVCYEIGFPEVARALALAGARLLLVPAAFGRAREQIWRTATVARALENQCYLAAAGQAGTNGELAFVGHSAIVDPWGRLMAEAGDDEEVVVADLEAGAVDQARAGRDAAGAPGWHAYLAERRPELYGALAERRQPAG
jgi:predicted amidohydrolase